MLGSKPGGSSETVHDWQHAFKAGKLKKAYVKVI